VTRRRVVVEESVSLSLGKYLDEPVALAEVMNAIDALADDPRPAGSVPWGPTISRLQVGLYRVLYEIREEEIRVRRIDRRR
jgi:mRNA interferase RelE/StbE